MLSSFTRHGEESVFTETSAKFNGSYDWDAEKQAKTFEWNRFIVTYLVNTVASDAVCVAFVEIF